MTLRRSGGSDSASTIFSTYVSSSPSSRVTSKRAQRGGQEEAAVGADLSGPGGAMVYLEGCLYIPTMPRADSQLPTVRLVPGNFATSKSGGLGVTFGAKGEAGWFVRILESRDPNQERCEITGHSAVPGEAFARKANAAAGGHKRDVQRVRAHFMCSNIDGSLATWCDIVGRRRLLGVVRGSTSINAYISTASLALGTYATYVDLCPPPTLHSPIPHPNYVPSLKSD
ncbi:hypothetical protein BDV93DRAFT_513128 [Ceratobasidium sp. AG-I]|nr:hypothetical protein BDV93DRAFT_513128 [Ceratobasidium sp. AG-I]